MPESDLSHRGIMPTLVTQYGHGKVTLDFGNEILVNSNTCSTMYIENPEIVKVVSFMSERNQSLRACGYTETNIILQTLLNAVYVNFTPSTTSKKTILENQISCW